MKEAIVTVVKERKQVYRVLITGKDYGIMKAVGVVSRGSLPIKGKIKKVWGWECVNGSICVGFPLRKQAVKHMVLSQIVIIPKSKRLEGNGTLFYKIESRPELPQA